MFLANICGNHGCGEEWMQKDIVREIILHCIISYTTMHGMILPVYGNINFYEIMMMWQFSGAAI